MLSDAQAWQHWLQWLPTAAPSDLPGPIFRQYHKSLTEAGFSETEADNRIMTILRLMRNETDGSQVFYNNIYTNPQPGFNTNPNALLVSTVVGRAPGRALDVCTGQGRNAVFLAIQGWDVTAIDVSNEGLGVARRNAEQAGVHVHTVLTSNQAFDLGSAAWDLIVMAYAPVPLTDPGYVRQINDALRPGGLIVIESFASDATEDGRTPVDIDPADLRRAFAAFRILHFADTVAMPDWMKTETRLARLVAEKRDTTA
jgi:2-polyprenyl-3-methyl-5-hydroxy-6-metoxy-1,4-benzoquinol methylase